MKLLRFGWAVLVAVHIINGLPAKAITRGKVEYLRTIPSVKEFTKPRSFLGKLVNLVVGPPDELTEVLRPYSTTHDSVGRLLVADPGRHGVHIFDFEKHKYQFLRGPRKALLRSPIDVACDSHDSVYVSDSEQAKVYVFDSRGKFQRTIGASSGKERLLRPTGMYLDRKTSRIYLTDTLRHQVMVYGLDGSLIRVIGGRGAGPGEFNYPTGLTLSGGKLYVVDAMNFRVQTITTEGKFVSSFGVLGNQTGNLNRPKGIATDTFGNIYLVDALFETVQVFDGEGRLLYYFGSSGANPGEFRLPSGISIDDRNIIYVADSLNRRVQVFRLWQVN